MQQDITGINSYTKQFSSGCNNITHLKQPALKCTMQQHPSLFLNCCILLHREWLGLRDIIVTIRADFQPGMELVSLFKMNRVTENYWFIYAMRDIIFSHCVNLKEAL